MVTVRLAVCGDEGTGKSSLITSLVKDVFVTTRIQPVLPPISLPPTIATPEDVTTWIIDTSAAPQERNALRTEIRKCNVILLVYSDHYSYERVALFWMPYFRSLGVNVPVVLCANKSDLSAEVLTPASAPLSTVVEEEMLPVMNEFKEIDSCIRTSAREHYNINEVFYLCQKAVTHPIAPIYDSKESALKPAAASALKRIFYLCDKDQDGLLNDAELLAFQLRCFDKTLGGDDLANIKRSVSQWSQGKSTDDGIDIDGFLLLNKMFAEKGRHETVWIILRKYNYTDSLSLRDSFLRPKFEVPRHASAELSPAGYRFFVDLFVSHDKDNDGGLNDAELAAAFAPTPGLPQSWLDSSFPSCTVRNEAGHVTLQGWLAQWSMTTFEEPQVTLEYLGYLGFEPYVKPADKSTGSSSSNMSGSHINTLSALKLTKPRKRRSRPGAKVDRNVFLCHVLGAPGSGKTSLLSAFVDRPFNPMHTPTLKPQVAVNSVELESGKQAYLILSEVGTSVGGEEALLSNKSKLERCDLLCLTYDSSEPNSFAHLISLTTRFGAEMAGIPVVYAALKADKDRAVQRSEPQPDTYTTENMKLVNKPLHISVTWARPAVQDFCVHLAESAACPSTALSRDEKASRAGQAGHWAESGRVGVYMAAGAAVCALTAFAIVWRRGQLESSS